MQVLETRESGHPQDVDLEALGDLEPVVAPVVGLVDAEGVPVRHEGVVHVTGGFEQDAHHVADEGVVAIPVVVLVPGVEGLQLLVHPPALDEGLLEISLRGIAGSQAVVEEDLLVVGSAELPGEVAREEGGSFLAQVGPALHVAQPVRLEEQPAGVGVSPAKAQEVALLHEEQQPVAARAVLECLAEERKGILPGGQRGPDGGHPPRVIDGAGGDQEGGEQEGSHHSMIFLISMLPIQTFSTVSTSISSRLTW